MTVPDKKLWRVRASSGDARFAIDDEYASSWVSDPSKKHWLEIDLGETATLAGLEVYWGAKPPVVIYSFEFSLEGEVWIRLCGTRHGEGGQDVFAFPPTEARFVRWAFDPPETNPVVEIVEINLYGPAEAAAVLEPGRVAALGYSPIRLPAGENITVDFRYARYPLGAFIEWGENYGTSFSVHLSDDGKTFREEGRIDTGDGVTDSFWWRSTTARFFRLTVHEANSPAGAVVNELKLRILNKDRMPIGRLERAASAGRGDLYPQSLLERQVYWTALGEADQAEEALFDEYGNLEPRRGSGQITPLLRLNGDLFGAPASADLRQSLVDGSLPIPTVAWSTQDVELTVTGFAHAGQAVAQYRITNRGSAVRTGALVLVSRPVQINPYWQHGGHANIHAIALEDQLLSINGAVYAVFSSEPSATTLADFDEGDVTRLIGEGPTSTQRSLRSESGLLSAASEFNFSLAPGASVAFVVSAPMRDGVEPHANVDFGALRDAVARQWRDKIGPRRITVGDREVSDTIEAQTALILVNATRYAFKPGPRNYDRTWIRDGSSQALALLWAGLIEDAKAFVRLVRQAHLPERPGAADPQHGRHGQPGLRQRHRIRRAGRIRRHRCGCIPRLQGSGVSGRYFRTCCAGDAVHRRTLRAHQCSAWPGDALSRPARALDQSRRLQQTVLQLLGRFLRAERIAELRISGAGDRRRRCRRGGESQWPDVRRESGALDTADRRGSRQRAHPRLGRSRGRRSDLDVDRLRALPGRRCPSARVSRQDL